MNEALILAPEVQARRALQADRLRLQVLVPPGSWLGCGKLRVLRVRLDEAGAADVTAGYEAYEPA